MTELNIVGKSKKKTIPTNFKILNSNNVFRLSINIEIKIFLQITCNYLSR